jgi:hypothetical protein
MANSVINLLSSQSSRALSALIADPNDSTLYARFAKETGQYDVFTYELGDHFSSVVQRLQDARSIGREFNLNVRGNYDGEVIKDQSMLEVVESYA